MAEEHQQQQEASCLCGKNRIAFSGPHAMQFICHCTDERKLTGAAFALNIVHPKSTLAILSGQLSTYTKTADSGHRITNHSCNTCGGLLYRTTTLLPDMMVLKAGMLDGDGDAADAFRPEVEVFTRSRLVWLRPLEGVKQEPGDFGSSEAEAAAAAAK